MGTGRGRCVDVDVDVSVRAGGGGRGRGVCVWARDMTAEVGDGRGAGVERVRPVNDDGWGARVYCVFSRVLLASEERERASGWIGLSSSPDPGCTSISRVHDGRCPE